MISSFHIKDLFQEVDSFRKQIERRKALEKELKVLQKQLLVRIDVVLRSLPQDSADFALHFSLAFSRSDHFFFGNRFFREQQQRNGDNDKHECRNAEGEKEGVLG